MNKIKNNKKGFTLAELLIVVAIIGVLVAVSVPIFKGSLNKAKIATNMANVRAAKAAAVCEYLQNAETGEIDYSYNIKDATITRGDSLVADDGKGIWTKISVTVDGKKVTTDPTADEVKENLANAN